MKRLMTDGLAVLATAGLLLWGGSALASGGKTHELEDHDWPHAGVFGTFDRAQLQRGWQVYSEVCAGCHAMEYLAFRNLTAIGFSEDEVMEIAADYDVEDGPDEFGDMFDRSARPSDYFPSPFPNEQAARYSNNGALPPDLSLIIKAREHGLDYTYSLLTGYEDEPPHDFELGDGMSYNPYFAGSQIAMPPPLFEEVVEYEDGTYASVDQMAEDVTVFLNWIAEPEMEMRKSVGLKVLIFLFAFSALFFAIKVKVWKKLH
jgi:ubiquinol-cytochrome c reductase cytochrome c1 subunit